MDKLITCVITMFGKMSGAFSSLRVFLLRPVTVVGCVNFETVEGVSLEVPQQRIWIVLRSHFNFSEL